MKVEEFKSLLAEANQRAALASLTEPETTHASGNCVVVVGLEGRKKQVAIKLGAEVIQGGLLFLPAPESQKRTPIRSAKVWAMWFANALASAGLNAYVMNHREQ